MAYYKITNNDRYICDTDNDKDSIAPIGAGATIIVLDTGMQYIWNGSRWVENLVLYIAIKNALEDAT